MSTQASKVTSNPLDWIARHKRETTYVLFGLGIAMLVLCVYLGWKRQEEWFPEFVCSGAAGLVFFGTGAWYINRIGDSLTEEEAARLLVLSLGAMIGLCIEAVGVWRIITWWSWLTGGTEKWQSEGGWRVVYWAIATLLGLGIIFASLLLARRDEKASPILRRLLYGYNTVLVVILTLVLLVVTNVIAANYVPVTSDWTKSALYTLDESQSQNIVKGLQKPLKVIVMTRGPGDPLGDDMTKLIDNCRNYTNQDIQLQVYSKDADRVQVNHYVSKYALADDSGVLVFYGNDEDAVPPQFIKTSDIYVAREGGQMRAPGDLTFNGEDALMTALVKLEDGKTPVIYFTQSNGELPLHGGARGQGAATLKRKLEKFYKVKGLKFLDDGAADSDDTVTSPTVPDDAAIVVVAGYSRTFDKQEADALRTYALGKDGKGGKGKLLFMLGVQRGPDGTMLDTGLDGLLSELGVDLGKNRVLCYEGEWRDPEHVPVGVKSPTFTSAENKLAKMLQSVLIGLSDVRTVDPKVGQGGAYQAESLLVVRPTVACLFAWAETNMVKTPADLVLEYFADEKGDRSTKKLTAAARSAKFMKELSVAVTVSEGGGPAFHGAPSDSKPKAIVIGNSTIASDEVQDVRTGVDYYYSLVNSSLAWLSEKPNRIGIAPKKHDIYQLKPDADFETMIWQPFAFMMLGVLGLGLGTWVARNR